MEADMDIEEHDIVDNPLIKNLLIDISSIKTEIEDYDEKDTSTCIHKVESDSTDFEELSDPNSSKVSKEEPVDPRTDAPHSLEEQSRPNGIVPDIKTPSIDEYHLPNVTIVLEDCKTFLEDNPCFCKECEILFPAYNDWQSHYTTVHSFLVEVNENKNSSNDNKLTCTHCDVVFPSSLDLLIHTYELLPNKGFNGPNSHSYKATNIPNRPFKNDSNKMPKNPNLKANINMPVNMFYMCTLCTCHFKLPAALLNHMRSFHHMNDIGDVKPEPSDYRCRICDFKCGSGKSYNTHVQAQHADLFLYSPVQIIIV